MPLRKFQIIVQARTNSSRMPGKIIESLPDGKCFLEVQLQRLKRIGLPIIVATTENSSDDIIIEQCNRIGIECFRGSEHNVLDRFIKCAEFLGAENIIRVCSDNPFIDTNSILKLAHDYSDEDYLSFSVDGIPSILTHSGFFAEIVKLNALRKVSSFSQKNCLEHVTNCIYASPESFHVRFIPVNSDIISKLRCTLDTKEDWSMLAGIYQNWYLKRIEKDFTYIELVDYLRSQPEKLQLMKQEIKKNTK